MDSQALHNLSDLLTSDPPVDFDFTFPPEADSLPTHSPTPEAIQDSINTSLLRVSSSVPSSQTGSSSQSSFFAGVFAAGQAKGLTISPIKGRGRTTPIWDHTPYAKDDVILNSKGKSVWQCKYCRIIYAESGGTRHINEHLLKGHKIELKTNAQIRLAASQQVLEDSFASVRHQNTGHKRRRMVSGNGIESFEPDVAEDLYVKWITSCGISLNMASLPEFRA